MRSDLLSLTIEGITALANAGLVKRAQKEIEQGKGPEIGEDAEGTVHGAFADGVTTRLPPGTPLREAFCSCGAQGVCRHRVAVALAYPAWHAAQQGSAGGEPAVAATAGSPGEIGDDALLARLGRKLLDRARDLARGGVTVEVRRPDATEPIATAALPSCTVRFLVANDPAWARCDCTARQDCEHVALAVWAFRAADARDPTARRLIVGLAPVVPVDAKEPEQPSALASAVRLGEEILLGGVVHGRESLAQRFALCREGLHAARLTWPLTALDDLEEALAAYRARSARYRAEWVAWLLAETAARERAGRIDGELPASFVLGRGEAMETRLDHLQLVGLGARVEADGRDREAAVYFADPDTATVLVLRRRWSFPEGEEPPDAPALGRRRAGSVATLAGLAAGQIVTKVARRRADRALVLGEARGGVTSVTPQAGAWESLPPPVRVTRLADLAASWKARPPRLLRPRVQAEDVHAVAVQAVEGLAFQPASQTLVAALRDADGVVLRLARPYRAVAPNALDHLAAALAGEHGPVRFVSGTLRRHLGGFEIDPLAVACDRLIVPDIVPDITDPLALAADRGVAADPPVEAAAAEALGILAEGAHHGLRHAPFGYPDRLRATAARLATAGLTTCAARLEALDATLRAARGGEESSWPIAAAAWMDAAIRLELVREVV